MVPVFWTLSPAFWILVSFPNGGRLEKPAKWPDELKETYGVRFVTRNNVSALLLTDDENGIYLSQKDIREVQLAKAAIASGIELLCQEMKVSDTDISQVLLAGSLRHLPFSKECLPDRTDSGTSP